MVYCCCCIRLFVFVFVLCVCMCLFCFCEVVFFLNTLYTDNSLNSKNIKGNLSFTELITTFDFLKPFTFFVFLKH